MTHLASKSRRYRPKIPYLLAQHCAYFVGMFFLFPREKKRMHRGGSFLCNDQYCSRYIVGTRGKGEVNTGTNISVFVV
jgi:hypothetical protein